MRITFSMTFTTALSHTASRGKFRKPHQTNPRNPSPPLGKPHASTRDTDEAETKMREKKKGKKKKKKRKSQLDKHSRFL